MENAPKHFAENESSDSLARVNCIYELVCPILGVPRYVGKTNNPASRLRGHIRAAQKNSKDHYCARWIRTLLARGLQPTMRILQTVPAGVSWQDIERRTIAEYRAMGYPITNLTAGGEGLDELSEEALVRRRVGVKKAWASRGDEFRAGMRTPEAVKNRSRATSQRFEKSSEREKQSVSSKAAWNRPEKAVAAIDFGVAMHTLHDGKRRAGHALAVADPAFKQKARDGLAAIRAAPGWRAVQSKNSKALWRDNRDRVLAAITSPEVKRKQSEKKKASWADPIVGAKMRAVHASAEVRAKKSAAALARATPEYREAMRQKTAASWARRKALQTDSRATA